MTEKSQPSIDLRSYYPRFERTLVWPDGQTFHIREIDDLSEAEFTAMVDDEQSFSGMSFADREAALRRHFRSMVVVPSNVRIIAVAGEESAHVDGEGRFDCLEGDVVFVTDGLYVDRNEVVMVSPDRRSVSVKFPWQFDVRAAGRIFRSVRDLEIAKLSRKQFLIAVGTVKTPPPAANPADPQTATNELTS